MSSNLIYNLVNQVKIMRDERHERILVVDDNFPMRKALTETLNYLKYETLEAENGLEALELIERLHAAHSDNKTPALSMIMSDLSMPVMDGRELFSELIKRKINLPFVMLSGYMASNALDDLKGMGLSGWLQKPAGIEQISELLDRILK